MKAGLEWRRGFQAALWVLGLVLLYLAIKYVAGYFLPFLIAVALALFIDPTVDALEERVGLPRGWAVAVTLVFFLGLVLGLILFTVGAVVVQLGELASNLPVHYERLVAFSEQLLERAYEASSGLPEDIVAYIDTSVRDGLRQVYVALNSLVQAILAGLKGLPSAFMVFMVSLVATFFISRDKHLIVDFGLSLLPEEWRSRAMAVNRDVFRSIVGLVKAQLTLVSLTALVTIAGLYVLGVRYAWLVGLLTGLLDVLPIVGPAAVLVPWSLYCLLDGNAVLGVGILVLYGTVSVARQMLEPKIIGERIGLHPLTTLLSLYLGIQLLGVSGLVVGPLVAIVIKAIVRSGNPPGRPGSGWGGGAGRWRARRPTRTQAPAQPEEVDS